jgi:hypothetical protein
MIKMFLIFLVLLSVPSKIFAASLNDGKKSELSILIQGKEVQINLPHEAYEAIKKWNSQFSVFDMQDFSPSVIQLFEEDKTAPMAFIGDVEGSGKNGIVLFGEDDKRQYVVAVVAHKKEWKIIPIYSTSIANIKESRVPSLHEAEEVGVPYYILPAQGEHAKKLKNKVGIQVEAYLGFAEVYQIKKGKAVKFTL